MPFMILPSFARGYLGAFRRRAGLRPIPPYPDPEIGMPPANNEPTPTLEVRRFLSSNDAESATCVMRYVRLDMSPFRMIVKEWSFVF